MEDDSLSPPSTLNIPPTNALHPLKMLNYNVKQANHHETPSFPAPLGPVKEQTVR